MELGWTSSMAVDSTPRSHSSDGSLWPQQMVWLYSLQPVTAAWENICWHRYLWWSPLGWPLSLPFEVGIGIKPLLCLLHQNIDFLLPAFSLWQSWLSCSHTLNWSICDNTNNNTTKHHRQCHYMPILHLTHWFTTSKPLNYAVSTKSGKTMRH